MLWLELCLFGTTVFLPHEEESFSLDRLVFINGKYLFAKSMTRHTLCGERLLFLVSTQNKTNNCLLAVALVGCG